MNEIWPNLIVFSSGTSTGGGSGFQKLVEASRSGVLKAKIVAVVSNCNDGGVANRARKLGIPFIHSPKGRNAEDYQRIVSAMRADFTALSGWLGLVEGLDPKTTFNIHPAWLPSKYAGQGFHGHHVHEAVIADYREGLVTHHGVSMHFVTPQYDLGPVFFRRKVEILPNDTADTLGARVNAVEHIFQPVMTNLVVTGRIRWDGEDPTSLVGADIET